MIESDQVMSQFIRAVAFAAHKRIASDGNCAESQNKNQE